MRMETASTPVRRISHSVLTVVALLIGAFVVTVEAYFSGYLDYVLSVFGDEWGPILIRALLVSAPFLLLAKRGVTKPMPWAVGLVLTTLVWGYIIFQRLSGAADNQTSVGGAISFGLVSLSSSVGITIMCALLSRRTKKPSSGT